MWVPTMPSTFLASWGIPRWITPVPWIAGSRYRRDRGSDLGPFHAGLQCSHLDKSLLSSSNNIHRSHERLKITVHGQLEQLMEKILKNHRPTHTKLNWRDKPPLQTTPVHTLSSLHIRNQLTCPAPFPAGKGTCYLVLVPPAGAAASQKPSLNFLAGLSNFYWLREGQEPWPVSYTGVYIKFLEASVNSEKNPRKNL